MKNNDLLWVALILLAFFIGGILAIIIPPVSAMGQPPTACTNLYDASIVSAIVTYPGGSLNALANPNATIDLQPGQTYNLTVVVLTDNASSNGSTSKGEVYLTVEYPTYAENACVDSSSDFPWINATSIGPHQAITATLTNETQYPTAIEPQHFGFSTITNYPSFPWAGDGISFYVLYQTTTSTSSSTSFPASTTTATVTNSVTSTQTVTSTMPPTTITNTSVSTVTQTRTSTTTDHSTITQNMTETLIQNATKTLIQNSTITETRTVPLATSSSASSASALSSSQSSSSSSQETTTSSRTTQSTNASMPPDVLYGVGAAIGAIVIAFGAILVRGSRAAKPAAASSV